MNFQNGCYGDPKDINTLLIFWQQMEKHHYPDARDMVERLRGIIEAQQQQLQAQLQEAQNQNKDLQVQVAAEQNRADGAEGYIDYLKTFNAGGNQ